MSSIDFESAAAAPETPIVGQDFTILAEKTPAIVWETPVCEPSGKEKGNSTPLGSSILGSPAGSSPGGYFGRDATEGALERAEKRPVITEPQNLKQFVKMVRDFANYASSGGRQSLYSCLEQRTKLIVQGGGTVDYVDTTVLFAACRPAPPDNVVLDRLKDRLFPDAPITVLLAELGKFVEGAEPCDTCLQLDALVDDYAVAVLCLRSRLEQDGEVVSAVSTTFAEKLKPKLLSTHVLGSIGDKKDHSGRMKLIVQHAKWWITQKGINRICFEAKDKSPERKSERWSNGDGSRPAKSSYEKKRVLVASKDSKESDKKARTEDLRCFGCGNTTDPPHRRYQCPCKEEEGFRTEGHPPKPPLALPADSEFKLLKKKK
jgi:hypothetical protein